jgi:outer membrane protein assembly factor BamB
MTAFGLAPSRRLAWVLVPLLALILAGCSGGQIATASWPSVSAGQDRVYVAHGTAVYAVDLEGDELWRYPKETVRDLAFYAAPAVSEDGMVYAGAYNGQLFALDAETGERVWEFPDADGADGAADGKIVGSPTIAGDLLLVPTDGGTLFFLDRQSGETLRTFDADGQLWSAPLVEGGTVYLASLSHTVYAIDLATAELQWSKDLGYAIADSPTLVDGSLLTGLLGNALVALQAADGSQVFEPVPTEGWLWGSPAVQDGIAYFGDSETAGRYTKEGAGNVYALDLRVPERTVWQLATTAVSASPIIVDGKVIVAFEDGQLIAYDPADGSPIWTKTAAGPIHADPVLVGDTVIVAVTSKEALLQGFDAASGDPAWTYLPASGS